MFEIQQIGIDGSNTPEVKPFHDGPLGDISQQEL